MERRRIAVRVALISFGFRVGQIREVRHLLREQDAVDALTYELEIEMPAAADATFLDFVNELIEMFLDNPQTILNLIMALIEMFSDPVVTLPKE